jgi:hypothetical protein
MNGRLKNTSERSSNAGSLLLEENSYDEWRGKNAVASYHESAQFL